MRTSWCLGLAAFAAACGPLNAYERKGDELRAKGDDRGAVEAYEKAMGERPIMDFDYERISEKRQRIVAAEWNPKISGTIAAASGDAIDRMTKLLVTRHEARAAAADKGILAPIEVEVRKLSTSEAFAATSAQDAETRIPRLLVLFEHAMTKAAPQQTIDAIVGGVRKSLELGLPRATDGIVRIERLFAMRRALRGNNLPKDLDAKITAELGKLADAPVAPVDQAAAEREFKRASGLRAQAVAYGETGAPLALLARAQDASLEHLLAPADQMIAAHRYVAAADYLLPLVRNVAMDHPLRTKYAQLGRDANAWHTQTAGALPAGYRKLLQLAQANAFGDTPGFSEQRNALSADFTTSLRIVPTYAAGSECAGVTTAITNAFGSGALAANVRVNLRCNLRVEQSTENRTFPYETQEEYTERVPYEVTERVWEQIGSHDEQCSKPSSLDGYVWTGVCKVPDYGWKTYTRTEYRDEVRIRDVTGSQPYTVSVKTAVAELSGTLSYTWEDGTVLSVPVEGRASDRTEAWSFQYPGRNLGEGPRTQSQPFSTTFSLPATANSAGASFARDGAPKLHTAVRAHRAKLARAAGAAALAQNDPDAAGEAFVRSVLLDGKAEAEAAAWMQSTHALTAEQAQDVLAGSRRGAPDLVALATESYTGGSPTARGDGYDSKLDDVAMDVSKVTEKTYHSGIKPPNEFVSMHIGAMPVNTHIAGGETRTSWTVGMGLTYSLLGMAAPRYWLTWHDEGQLRLIFGQQRGKREYTNDEEESVIAWGFVPAYRAFVGFRHHYFSLFGGAGIGWTRMRSGDTLAKGRNAEPAARMTLRVARINNLVLEASGFKKLFDSWETKDRVAIGIPLKTKMTVELLLSWERIRLNTTDVHANQSDNSLGKQETTFYGVQVGGRL